MKNPTITNQDPFEQDSMTLRDYFAAKEKAVLLNLFYTNKEFKEMVTEDAKLQEVSCGTVLTQLAFSGADAMLKERFKN